MTYFQAELNKAQEAIEQLEFVAKAHHDSIVRVRELHNPINIGSSGHPEWLICKECSCDDCGYPDYPCETIQALDGEK